MLLVRLLIIACLLLLTGSGQAWKQKGVTGGKDSPQVVAKHAHSGKSHEVQYQMPKNAFVRIFALPSAEARAAQHRLGELLASSCKTYNRVGECKMYSAKVEAHHIRLLKFTEGSNSSVVAYMLQENESEIEKALDTCVSDDKKDVMSHENGGDYRCYETQAVKIPSVDEVLVLVKDQLKQAELYDHLQNAPHKSVFLTSDPKAIIFQESQRLTGDNKDPDHFTQKLRDSFRPIVEWLAWQYTQYSQLAKGTPMLYCHAEELDMNEHAEVNRVLEFMGIGSQAHAGKKIVTATLGEENYQRQKLKNDIATLPSALSADIDEFLIETLQEKELVDRYLTADLGNRTALWPPKKLLHNVAFDNTLLVTAVTCEYAPLVINWLKHLHDVQFPCYLVVALDESIYNFLHNWLPDHVVRAPPGFTEVMPRQYAVAGTAAMRHVARARLNTLRAINKQGYNVAWADADIAFTKNVFTVISRWWDLEATWVDGNETPLEIQDKTVGYELKFNKNDTRKISPSFLYFKGSENARNFLDKWYNASNVSPSVEDGAVLNQLLRDPEVNTKLNIEMLAEADFPTGEVLFGKQPEAYKKAWKTESYAWAHPDNGLEKEDKIKLLSEKFWKVVPEDPIPTCPKAYEEYLPNGTAVAKWPPGEKLESIAIDNTILLTSATCEYADLVSNWVKRTWDLGISCFFVAGHDSSVTDFLTDWVPDHAAQMPESIVKQVSDFAEKNTSDYTKVLESKPRVIRHILDQGYNVAWSDADVWWLKNPFTLFDRSPDLVLAWADSSEMLEGGVFPAGELVGGGERRISTSFFFVKPSRSTIMLMDAWAASLDDSGYVDDSAALQKLLLRSDFSNLSVGIFASPLFPSLAESTNSTSEDLQGAWQEEALKPAWVHTDSLAKHDSKVSEFKRLDHWLTNSDDPLPKCNGGISKKSTKKVSESKSASKSEIESKSTGKVQSKSPKKEQNKSSGKQQSKSKNSNKIWGRKKHKN